MNLEKPTPFDFFKKKNRWIASAAQSDAVLRILFEEERAFLQVENSDCGPFSFNFQQYFGPERPLLLAMKSINHQLSLLVDWENPERRIYLTDHEHLIGYLKNCRRVVDQTGNALHFADEPGEVVVHIDETEDLASFKVFVRHRSRKYSTFRFLTESLVLIGENIISIPPLDQSFQKIKAFITKVKREELDSVLSLLFSNFTGFRLEWEGWTLREEEPGEVESVLVIERVDSDKNLYLKVDYFVPGLPVHFLTHYEVRAAVRLNEVEKIAAVSQLIFPQNVDLIDHIKNILNKLQRKLKIKNGYIQDDNLFIITDDLATNFILHEFTKLLFQHRVFGSDKLVDYKVHTKQPKLRLALNHGLNFLEGECELEFSGETMPLMKALALYEKNAYIPLNNGHLAVLDANYVKKLKRIFKKNRNKVSVSFFDLPELDDLIEERALEKAPRKIRDFYQDYNHLQDNPIRVPRIQGTPRPYQKAGYQWLSYLVNHDLAPVLADEMGLGKTLQAIMLLASFYPRVKKSTLIIMPRTLLFNWQEEIRKFCPRLSVHVYHGTLRDREAIEKHQLTLTTYSVVRNDIETLKEMNFFFVILDESQKIKNLQTKTAKAILLLKSEKRLAISGTPIENNLGELYSLFRFLNPGMFGSLQDFQSQYANPIQRDQDHEAAAHLKRKIFPFILRRIKKDVIKDLPDKMEQTLMVDMSEKQAALYEDRRKFYEDVIHNKVSKEGFGKSRFFIFQALNELRQIATQPEVISDGQVASPKRQVLMEYIQDLVSSGKKALVFSNFLRTLENVSGDLHESGIQSLKMTGATMNRADLVRRFQQDTNISVFTMTLKTGGVGLNLTAAEYIFIMDPWWNRAAENQAIDRTHRIGQKNTVFSYRLIMKGTIEEKILKLQEIKKDLFNELITADSGPMKHLNEEDLGFLLGR